MFNLVTFVSNLARLISGSHFRTDYKAETDVVFGLTKHYLKLSTSDKDYQLYRFAVNNGDIDIFVIKELDYIGVNEYLLASIALQDILEDGKFDTGNTNFNTVMACIIKAVMTHYTCSKADKLIPLPLSVPLSFDFKTNKAGPEILLSVANSIVRNTKNAVVRDSVVPNSLWIYVGGTNGNVFIRPFDNVLLVMIFTIGYDGMTGGNTFKYTYHDVYYADDIFSLNDMVTKICEVCN